MGLGKLYSSLVGRLPQAPQRPKTPPLMFRTPRLLLRELEELDLDPVWAYRSDPEVVRHLNFNGPQTRAQVKRYVEQAWQQRHQLRRANYELGLVLLEEGCLIGECGLTLIYPNNAAAAPYAGLLGFMLRRDYWGRGYTTEAARAILRFAFAELNLETVYAGCLPENHASRRVLEKSGLTLEGLRSEFPGCPPGGVSLAFRATREQWLSDYRAAEPG